MEIPPEVEELCVSIDIAFATIKELQEEWDELKDGPEISIEADIISEVEELPVCEEAAEN